ncbi:MAG TPA: hypothetical protein VIM73_03315 [Polyangiaceae bacterium]
MAWKTWKLPRDASTQARRGGALAGLAVALAITGLAGESRAQSDKSYPPCDRQPTETDIAGAKGAFQAGQASFDEADYRRAIDYWEDAYRRDCTAHALLLNLARAYELNGEKAEAVVALETYLQREPSSPDKDKIERRLEVLARQLEEEQARAAAPPPPPPPPPVASPAPTPAPAQEAPVSTPNEEEPSGRSIVPLFVAGAGGAIAVIGGILYASAQSDLSDAEDQCPERVCPPNRPDLTADANDARSRAQLATGVTLGGVAVLGGGLAWYLLSAPKADSPSASRLVPIALPSYAGLSYSGAF